MSTASDTPGERLAEYHRLYERALLRRERAAHEVMLWFRAEERALVEDLARREAACCPFLDYRVEAAGGEVVWTITNGGGDQEGDATLEAFYALPRSRDGHG
jgi:hypothetical protein